MKLFFAGLKRSTENTSKITRTNAKMESVKRKRNNSLAMRLNDIPDVPDGRKHSTVAPRSKFG